MTVMDALIAAHRADPETTESMIDDIVRDVLADDAIDNEALLTKAAGAYVAHRTSVAKRALLRQYVSDLSAGSYPDDEVFKAAEWLAGLQMYTVDVVTKAAYGGGPEPIWQENKHRRDRGGRFARGVNQGAKVNPLERPAHARVAPLRNMGNKDNVINRDTGLPHGVTPENAARMQAQYEQADEILREFGASFSSADQKKINAVIQYSDKNGNVKTLSAPLSEAGHGMPDSAYNTLTSEDSILSIEVDAAPDADDKLAEQVRRFNTLGGMGGSQLAALSNLPKGKRDALSTALMPRKPEQSKLSALFGRAAAGADVLENQGQDKLASMARFMGEYGPEAEKVLDPHVRQNAYRYRGTEKEPDILLMRQMNSPDMNTTEAAAREGGHGPISDAVLAGSNQRGAAPVEGATRFQLERARREGEPLTEDQLNMRVRSDVAAMHLLKTLPLDKMVSDLSRKSGNILPSQGVLIDADGDVVSQSVGFGDDTYLPFNYANMKQSMRGGQYVRTRVQGGLSGEDIAAAVGNGARMATVVSSSGVHSIEFDPNLRGARGGSDKARSMYRRYLQILDAVENSGLYTQDIDPREKAKLRSQAAQITGEHSGPQFDAAYQKMEERARAEASSLSEDEMDGLMERAKTMVASEGGSRNPAHQQRRINDVYEELESQATEEKASRLRLNAEGYQVALQTLQQQFPYFIRNVSYEPLAGKDGGSGFLNDRGQQGTPGALRQRLKATDKGYMRPGGIRAHTVQGGFYRTDQPMEGAQGASSMKTPLSGERAEAPKTPPTGSEGGAAAGPEGTPPSPEGGTPAAPGLAGPVGGPQGGLMGLAAMRARGRRIERDQALTELQTVFGTLNAARVNMKDTVLDQPFEEVAKLPDEQVAAWFLSQDNPKAALDDPTKAARLGKALTNRAAMQKAFGIALGKGPGQDYFDGNNDFGGHKTKESAANYVADLAQKVIDTELQSTPFVNKQPGDAWLSHKGTRPQALEINGVNVNDLDTPEKYETFRDHPSNKNLMELARAIGTDENDRDNYKPMVAVAEEVSNRISVLNDLENIIAKVPPPSAAGGMDLGAADIIDPNTNMDTAKFMATLDQMVGKPVRSGSELLALKNKWDIKSEQAKLQQAWSMVNAGQVHANLAGGGASPKGPAEIWKAQPLRHPEASSRRALPVVVRKDSTPLAREISRRRAAGLPFVPVSPGTTRR